ncbi:U32 family peptidase [Breznakia sp. OttesenSCG-928-G09]|nr:U32 family peptidase [Breznakia sp. OttesenSCG-928-G09]
MVNIIASPYRMDDITSLKQAGATTIVVGTDFFSVRSVSHFKQEELKEIKNICEVQHLKLYVLVNRFFVENELEALREYLKYLKAIDVDGIYFTDIGVLYEAKQLEMDNKLIYNPETMLTNSLDIQEYLDLGIKMATISKEITLENMLEIAKKVRGELEVIIHGRLNMMHSKRMLLTNYMKFLKKDMNLHNDFSLYLMEEKRDEHLPIVEDEEGTHIYTGFTLASFEEIHDFIEAGILNLRIESMFLSIDDVCQIIKDYRYVIEHPREGRKMYKEYEEKYLEQNITKGFMYKKTGVAK